MAERQVKTKSGGNDPHYAARRHLEYLFKPFIEAGSPGAFVVAHVERKGAERPLWLADFFPLSEDGVDRAIAYAARHASSDDIYVRPGVVRADYKGSADKVRNEDIVSVNAIWIDCDEADHFNVINSHDEDSPWPEPTFHVITGTKPELRRQSFWILDTPCRNMKTWRALSDDLQAFMGSDAAVANEARYMRLAGFLSHPKPDKPGRVTEPVLARPAGGQLVDFNEAYAAFEGAKARAARGDNIVSEPSAFGYSDAGWWMDSGAGKSDAELIAMLDMARADGRWHVNVRDVVASLIGRGYSDAVVKSFLVANTRVDGGFADNDVDRLIAGARKAWNKPNHDGRGDNAADVDMDADVGPRIQSAAEFAAGFTPPEYLVAGIVRRSYCYGFTAPTGTGKTAIALDLALSIATGRPFAGHPVEQGPVIFLAGENPDDVCARLILLAHIHGVELESLPLYFIPTRYDVARDMETVASQIEDLGGASLIIVDTSAAYFPGDDENSNAAMGQWAGTLRRFCAEMPGKPAVVVPCHPKMSWNKDAMTPRGGSAFLAEIDGNLALWPDGEAVKMHWSGKHRGPDFEPVMWEMLEGSCDALRDASGEQIQSAWARPISQVREEQIAEQTATDEDALLVDLKDNPNLSYGRRCTSLGWIRDGGEPQKSKLDRALSRLEKDGFVRRVRGAWRLTGAGNEEAENVRMKRGGINLGGNF